MKTRQLLPDWIKGMAIFLMVYGHITHVGNFSIFQKQIVEVIYTFHMPLFLIISGFFLNTKNDPYEMVKKVINRIFFPYLIFIIIYLISLILVQKIGFPTTNIPPATFFDFIKVVLFHPIGPYWFLHSLILIQMCFVIVGVFAKIVKLEESLYFVIVLFLLAILSNYNLIKSGVIVYFLLGMVTNRFHVALPNSVKTGLLLIISIIVFAKDEIFLFSFVQVVWSLSIMTFLLGIGSFIESNKIVSIFAWFGRNSLIVLVLHGMFIVSLKPISSLVLRIDNTGLLYSAVVVTITMLSCMLMAFFLDKIKVSTYIFGVEKIYSKI
jgi:fucose 4-O-acetylase-like acetyltransferase